MGQHDRGYRGWLNVSDTILKAEAIRTCVEKPWISENTWYLINSRIISTLPRLVLQRHWCEMNIRVLINWSRNEQGKINVNRVNRSPPMLKISLMNTNGFLTISKEEQIFIWEQYYKELILATDRETESLCSCTHHVQHARPNITCSDTREIASAIDPLKTN